MDESSFPGRLVGGGIALVLLLVIGYGSYFTVQPNEVGVVTWLGKIERTATSGAHLKMPFLESVRLFRTDISDLNNNGQSANTYTIDNQEVDVTFNVFYRIPADKVAYIYKNIPDYQQRLYVMTIDRIKSAMGQVNIQALAEKRGELRDRILHTLQVDSNTSLGLDVTGFQLTNFQYDQRFRNAVANAAVQKANVESVEYQLQQAEKQAEMAKVQAEGQANAAREQAKGAADSRLFNAQAEAKAIQLEGDARAEAIKSQAEALKANPDLVNLRKAERWDGKLPTSIYAGAPIPFLGINDRGLPAK